MNCGASFCTICTTYTYTDPCPPRSPGRTPHRPLKPTRIRFTYAKVRPHGGENLNSDVIRAGLWEIYLWARGGAGGRAPSMLCTLPFACAAHVCGHVCTCVCECVCLCLCMCTPWACVCVCVWLCVCVPLVLGNWMAEFGHGKQAVRKPRTPTNVPSMMS
jgi:hypothetical protein